MAASSYAENKIIDHLLGTTLFTKPTTVYIGLCSDAAPDANTFTEVDTPGSHGYARQACTWNASSSGAATNITALDFGPCATTPWAQLRGFGVFDNLTAGNRLTQGQLTDQTKTVGVGDHSTVAAGALTVTCT